MDKKKILVLTEMAFQGSGYYCLMSPILEEMSKKYDIKVIGLSYDGTEYNFGFSITPASDVRESVAIAQTVIQIWKPDIFICGLDIPLQISIHRSIQQLGIKYIAITPLENPPLTQSWAASLMGMDYVFFISELGKQAALKVGLNNIDHLQVAADTKNFYPVLEDDRNKLRSDLGITDEFTILTVADNQERKNLWAEFEIISKLKQEGRKVKFILVTREHSPVGYKLRDLAMEYDLNKELVIIERGIDTKQLHDLYVASDVYLSTSKAEGLCVFPDNKLWTTDGEKKILDIFVGNSVVSHTGELNPVSEIFERSYDGDMVTITPKLGFPPITLTPNHKVLGSIQKGKSHGDVGDLEWIDSQSMKKGDFIYYPKSSSIDLDSILISNWVDRVSVDNNGRVHTVGRNQFGAKFEYSSREKEIYNEVRIKPNFMKLLGWYIAEGCDTGEGLSFSLNTKEVEFQDEIKELVKEVFNFEVRGANMDRSRYEGRVYSRILGNLFSRLCGDESHRKHIPQWALHLPEDKLWPLVESMFCGDGTFQLKPQTKLRYSTVSKELAYQLQYVLTRLGVMSSVVAMKTRCEYVVNIAHPELHKVPFLDHKSYPQPKKTQSTGIELEKGFLLQIGSVSVSHYEGMVYNLEVEQDNSFLLQGGMVHNCMPILEAMASDLTVMATDTGAITELLEEGRGFLIPYEYEYRDPWGNSIRKMIDIEDAYKKLSLMAEASISNPKKLALDYAKSRTIDIPVAQLTNKIEELTNG